VIDRAQLKTLSENPLVSIGSHGVRHCDSNKLTDAEFELEIAESKRALEEGTGRGVDSFSFPHGEFSGRHLEILSRHGYRRAFSISPETAPAKGTSFIYGRFHCSGREWPLEFLLKASGAYRWLGTISRIKGLMFNKTGNRT
jgi:peptidoglycan/xylan/chitin deacetylase (PgdA/CDA1 family)